MRKGLRCITALCLAVILMASNAYAGSVFPDVDDNAGYAEAAKYLNEIGIMQGDEKGNFNPDKTVSRAEMAAIICRVLGETENRRVSSRFSDVPENHWANGYIAKIAELGIINGYGNGKFGPSDSVTFEQALKMIMNALGLEDAAIAAGGYPDGYISAAHDCKITSQISAQKGNHLRRWETASIIYNGLRNRNNGASHSLADEIRSVLTSHAWDASVQITSYYHFNADGTGENLPSLRPVTYTIDESASVVHVYANEGEVERWTYSSGKFSRLISDGPDEYDFEVRRCSAKDMYNAWTSEIDGAWSYAMEFSSSPNSQTSAVIEDLNALYESIHTYLGSVLSGSSYSKLDSDLAAWQEQMENEINQVGLDGSMQRLSRVIIRKERTMEMVKEMIERIP